MVAILVLLLAPPQAAQAQGLVKGVQQGAEAGNKAAGPVGGVLGGAIGGVVGVFTGVLGVPGPDNNSVQGPVQGGGVRQHQGKQDGQGREGRQAGPTAEAQATHRGAGIDREQIVANSRTSTGSRLNYS